MRKFLTKKQRLEIVELYKAGEKCEYIAALYGVRREYPSKLSLRRGVPHRFPSMRKMKNV